MNIPISLLGITETSPRRQTANLMVGKESCIERPVYSIIRLVTIHVGMADYLLHLSIVRLAVSDQLLGW